VLTARSSGFLVDVDEGALVGAAEHAGVVLQLVPRIGDAVVVGTPLAHAWARDPAALDRAELEEALDGAVQLEFERSTDRDVAYGLRKVVDIAVRALSPGTNDPTTAVHAISHVSALLGELVVHPPVTRRVHDEDGRLRLVVRPWEVAALVSLAFEEPVQFAENQPGVARRLAVALRELAWRAPRGSIDDLVRRLLDQLVTGTRRSTAVPETELAGWHRDVEDALRGSWPPVDLPEPGRNWPPTRNAR